MSAIKSLIEELKDHPAFQGHPWNPAAPAHYEPEPEAHCIACKEQKPVSELFRLDTTDIVCTGCWEETCALVDAVSADAESIGVELGQQLQPDRDTVSRIRESVAKLSALWE